jgi:AcrR family transcriptional regulator
VRHLSRNEECGILSYALTKNESGQWSDFKGRSFVTKEEIRQVSLDLFSRISFSKTSVSDIANACGLGKGTIYLYYQSKDEIFASIIEERIKALTAAYDAFYEDTAVPFDDKISTYTHNMVDEYFAIKDLLFGSFENVQGKILKDVFFKFNRCNEWSTGHLLMIITRAGLCEGRNMDELKAGVDEFVEFLVGRILVYLVRGGWNDKDGLKTILAPLALKLFNALILA